MKVLFIGDVFSEIGRVMIMRTLSEIKRIHEIDFVICNGENAAHGKGITSAIYNKLLEFGVNAITMGNHVFSKLESSAFFNDSECLIIPNNLNKQMPGKGSRLFQVKGHTIRVTNLMGIAFINDIHAYNPFESLDELLTKTKEVIHIVDFHAEATAEKMAFAYDFDGKVSAVLGTHTHVQTVDERILPNGTAYISDVGMTGPHDGIIGAKKEEMIYRSRTGLPSRFEVAKGDGQLSAVVLDIDEESGKSRSIKRIYITPYNVYGL